MKAVLYVRVSSKEQSEEGYSIPAQRKLLEAYARQKGLEVVRQYEEVETAKKAGRTEFSKMVSYLQKHSGVEHLLVEKTDRLYRNFRDLVAVDDLRRTIHFVKENVVLGPDSRSAEKLSHNIKVVLAKNYIDNLSEETSKGMLEKAQQGLWPSCAPVGYVNNTQTGMIEVDWPKARILQKLFEVFGEGQTSLLKLEKLGIAEGLRSRNGRPVRKPALAIMLRNPIYIGDFKWKDVYYHGKHDPIISRDLFERVQNAYRRGHSRKGHKLEFAFRGLLTCAHCGCTITVQRVKGEYTYYFCTKNRGACPQRYVREEELAEQLGEPLKRLRVTPERLEWILRAIRESSAEERVYRERESRRLEEEEESLERKIDALYEDKLGGVVSEAFWKRKYEELSQRQARARADQERLLESRSNYLSNAEQVIKLSQEAYSLYITQNRSEQRKMANLLYSNCQLRDGKVEATLAKPFDLIADGVEKESRLRERSLPGPLTDPIWLPFRDSLRKALCSTVDGVDWELELTLPFGGRQGSTGRPTICSRLSPVCPLHHRCI